MMNDELQVKDLGNLAPIMNVVSIAGYLNPKLVSDEAVEAIAQSTGTPPELVECVVEAVDEVNNLMDAGKEPETLIKNFSDAMQILSKQCMKLSFAKPVIMNSVGIANLVSALHEEDIAGFSSSDLASQISTFVPVNFDNLNHAISYAKPI